MRILSWFFISIGIIFYSSLAVTAAGLELNKITADEDWAEGEPTKSIIRLDADGKWDWLRLGLAGKFFIVPVDDQYSSLDTKLVMPAVDDDLVIKAGYDWNKRYEIYDAGVDYSFRPLKPVIFQLGYRAEERRAELITGCPYHFNNELIAFTWNPEYWKYGFTIVRTDKNYFEDPQYTSLKYQLVEKLEWSLWPDVNFQIEYNENTGDYSAASYKDFWKQEWVIKGEYETQSKWQYNWEYSKLYWERGFEPYRSTQKVQMKIHKKLNLSTKMIFGATYGDLDYYSKSQDYSEPGIYNPIETDLRSRVESKLGLEFQFNHSNYSWEVGSFFGNIAYDSGYNERRNGIYGTFVWKLRQLELSLKAAPVGDMSTQDAYYKLEIVYKL